MSVSGRHAYTQWWEFKSNCPFPVQFSWVRHTQKLIQSYYTCTPTVAINFDTWGAWHVSYADYTVVIQSKSKQATSASKEWSSTHSCIRVGQVSNAFFQEPSMHVAIMCSPNLCKHILNCTLCLSPVFKESLVLACTWKEGHSCRYHSYNCTHFPARGLFSWQL